VNTQSTKDACNKKLCFESSIQEKLKKIFKNIFHLNITYKNIKLYHLNINYKNIFHLNITYKNIYHLNITCKIIYH